MIIEQSMGESDIITEMHETTIDNVKFALTERFSALHKLFVEEEKELLSEEDYYIIKNIFERFSLLIDKEIIYLEDLEKLKEYVIFGKNNLTFDLSKEIADDIWIDINNVYEIYKTNLPLFKIPEKYEPMKYTFFEEYEYQIYAGAGLIFILLIYYIKKRKPKRRKK